MLEYCIYNWANFRQKLGQKSAHTLWELWDTSYVQKVKRWCEYIETVCKISPDVYRTPCVHVTSCFESFPDLNCELFPFTLSFLIFSPELYPTFLFEIFYGAPKKGWLFLGSHTSSKGHLDDALRLSDASETGLVGAWDWKTLEDVGGFWVDVPSGIN